LAQGWIPELSPEQFRDARHKLQETLKKYGRGISEIEFVREISVSLDKNHERAAAKYKRTPAYEHSVSLMRGWGKDPASFESDLETSLMGASGQVISGIQEYLDADVNHFMLNFAVGDAAEFTANMEAFAKDVVPSFT
jgi:alkanesulfonate monooxygenase SsuD/methylene tetrahydromethanopterin reductase-like flavin-dependent oxidoreductase (luciferase family)